MLYFVAPENAARLRPRLDLQLRSSGSRRPHQHDGFFWGEISSNNIFKQITKQEEDTNRSGT